MVKPQSAQSTLHYLGVVEAQNVELLLQSQVLRSPARAVMGLGGFGHACAVTSTSKVQIDLLPALTIELNHVRYCQSPSPHRCHRGLHRVACATDPAGCWSHCSTIACIEATTVVWPGCRKWPARCGCSSNTCNPTLASATPSVCSRTSPSGSTPAPSTVQPVWTPVAFAGRHARRRTPRTSSPT